MQKSYLPFYYPNFLEKAIVYFLLRYRRRKYGTGFRKIKLYIANKRVKNRCAVVSPKDYKKISQYRWQLVEEKDKPCYAVRLEGRKMISMHREIMGAQLLKAARNRTDPFDLVQQGALQAAQGKKIVHHKDGDGLNNTKENLQIVTVAENNRYCRKRGRGGSSKYKGVSIHKRSGKWQASIKYDGVRKSLGSYESEEEAGRAYDEAAKIYHGQYAVLNFREEKQINPLECVTTGDRIQSKAAAVTRLVSVALNGGGLLTKNERR
ncbi:MAG: AP2 domain-containing protein [Phycisphaerae bacterium]|nr:AP2 domain-containing protein [Phycisphaerae bacterium]